MYRTIPRLYGFRSSFACSTIRHHVPAPPRLRTPSTVVCSTKRKGKREGPAILLQLKPDSHTSSQIVHTPANGGNGGPSPTWTTRVACDGLSAHCDSVRQRTVVHSLSSDSLSDSLSDGSDRFGSQGSGTHTHRTSREPIVPTQSVCRTAYIRLIGFLGRS